MQLFTLTPHGVYPRQYLRFATYWRSYIYRPCA